MKYAVLDIETIADAEGLRLAGLEKAEGIFPPWPLHEIVCVSLLVIDSDICLGHRFSIQSHVASNLSEAAIIRETERTLAGVSSIVTFNGRGFDVPALIARAAVHQISAPTIAKLHAQRRYSSGSHIDLLDEVTHYGAAPRVRLADLCAAFRIPSKLGADGGQVGELVAGGEWERVSQYCEQDVICTYLAWQRWQAAERDAHEIAEQNIGGLVNWIEAQPQRLQHLRAFTKATGRSAIQEALPATFYPILGW